ncbi:uncharacterized protein LOC117792097 [Drosophila innubila]|uniref:uncharacterized protein LOC117792097 n=1 Tax=Drosophila innubila TaxID=198719 RepID=UPI00148CCBC7|nr:uncharacterized protein LOC117792097 [Drosophila innubila]
MGGTTVTSAKLENAQVMHGCGKPKVRTKTGSCSEVVHVNINVNGSESVGTGTAKGKRKSSVIKIAETTQLLTRFSRTRNNIGVSSNAIVQKKQLTQMQRLIFKSQPGSVSEQMQNASADGCVQQHQQKQQQHSVHSRRTTGKFKTGGIVVTAVQQSAANNTTGSGCVSRRIRHSSGMHKKCGSSGETDGAVNMLQQYRNSSSVQMSNKPAAAISLDTASLVRKVKTKFKKRKSRTLANAVATAVVK